MKGFKQANQEYEYRMKYLYDWYDDIPNYEELEYEDPEVDRRLEDQDE